MSRKDDYTLGKSLDYLCHQKHNKLIGIDLFRQKSTNSLQEIDFPGKLE